MLRRAAGEYGARGNGAVPETWQGASRVDWSLEQLRNALEQAGNQPVLLLIDRSGDHGVCGG